MHLHALLQLDLLGSDAMHQCGALGPRADKRTAAAGVVAGSGRFSKVNPRRRPPLILNTNNRFYFQNWRGGGRREYPPPAANSSSRQQHSQPTPSKASHFIASIYLSTAPLFPPPRSGSPFQLPPPPAPLSLPLYLPITRRCLQCTCAHPASFSCSASSAAVCCPASAPPATQKSYKKRGKCGPAATWPGRSRCCAL